MTDIKVRTVLLALILIAVAYVGDEVRQVNIGTHIQVQQNQSMLEIQSEMRDTLNCQTYQDANCY